MPGLRGASGAAVLLERKGDAPPPPPPSPPASEVMSSRWQRSHSGRPGQALPQQGGIRLPGSCSFHGLEDSWHSANRCRLSQGLHQPPCSGGLGGGGPSHFWFPTHTDATSALLAPHPFSHPDMPGVVSVSYVDTNRPFPFITSPAIRCQRHASAFLTSFMTELNNQGSVFRVRAVDLEGPQASSRVGVALWLVRLCARTAVLTSTWLCVWLAVDTSALLLWASPPSLTVNAAPH